MTSVIATQMLGDLSSRLQRSRAAKAKVATGGARYVATLAGRGRHGQVPDFSKPAVAGTRPTSGRGVTFHFKHTYVSKLSGGTKSQFHMTSASAHQAYIERPGAAERVPDDKGDLIPASFGTIDITKGQRVAFWDKVELAEGRTGRVQCRLIVELPHELGAVERLRVARRFCEEFEKKKLPYWSVLHTPGPTSDPRNFHLHVCYYDRPAQKIDGKWDFEITEARRYASRNVRMIRPEMQKKDRTAQGPSWLLHLRESYALAANQELSARGEAKRYDPRSYWQSGVEKAPTRHLGTKAASLELTGRNTKTGSDNASKEIDFRQRAAGASDLDRHKTASKIVGNIDHLRTGLSREFDRDDQSVQVAYGLLETHRKVTENIVEIRRQVVDNEIDLEALAFRIDRRKNHVDADSKSLLTKSDDIDQAGNRHLSDLLFEEAMMMEETRSEVSHFILDLQRTIKERETAAAILGLERDSVEAALRSLEAKAVQSQARHLGVSVEEVRADLEFAALVSEIKSQDTLGASPQAPTLNQGSEGRDSSPSNRSADVAIGTWLDRVSAPTNSTPAPSIEEFLKGNEARIARGGPSAPPAPPAALDAWLQARTNMSPEIGVAPIEPMSQAPNPVPSPVRRGDYFLETPEIDGAIRFEGNPTNLAVREFMSSLSVVDNKTLRWHAQATADAIDLTPDRSFQGDYKKALRVIAHIADLRGFDLDTGVHKPELAKDPNLAKQHVDTLSNPEFRDIRSRVR